MVSKSAANCRAQHVPGEPLAGQQPSRQLGPPGITAARQFSGPAGVARTSRLLASRLLPGAAVSSSRTPRSGDGAPELISARVWPSAAHDRQPWTAPGPKAGPTSGPSSTRPAPVARVDTCRPVAPGNGPTVTASLLASGETARPDTTRPGGCSGIASGYSRARPAGVRLAGSTRSRKNRAAGGVLSGSRASFCAASTNVRLCAAKFSNPEA